MTEFLKTFQAARRVSTPLISISTPDMQATINLISSHCSIVKIGEETFPVPIIIWDIARGFWTLVNNKAGQSAIAELGEDGEGCMNPRDAAKLSQKFPDFSVVFVMNAHKFFQDIEFIQAVWNLRDQFKKNLRSFVMLGPDLILPPELSHDVVSLSEPLPSPDELKTIILTQFKNAKLKEPSADILARAIDAIAGLPAFPAEQVTAMSLTKDGLDLKALWTRKKTQVEQTLGLNIETEEVSLEDVKDADNVIDFMRRYLKNVAGIVFIDEIGDQMSGVHGDTSGVSQKMQGTILSFMQDRGAKGIMLMGVAGTGKSMTAKAAGSVEGKPVIRMNLSAMEGSLVGESVNNLNTALKVVDAVCQGKALFIATTNNLKVLTPQLRSRFRQGTFFYDLPSKSGRKFLWELYIAKNGLSVKGSIPGFNDSGWTGREIMTCCENARDLGCTLQEASAYIVPMSKSNADDVARLQNEAKGRYISASKPGLYQLETETKVELARNIQLT